MLMRGSPCHGILKIRWLVPFWRGSPKNASQTLRKSAKRTFVGSLRNCSRIFLAELIGLVVPLLAPQVKTECKPCRCGFMLTKWVSFSLLVCLVWFSLLLLGGQRVCALRVRDARLAGQVLPHPSNLSRIASAHPTSRARPNS